MDVNVLIDACLALALVAAVVSRPAAVLPARVRRAAQVVLTVAVLVQAGLLISSVGDSTDIALRLLEDTETNTKLLQQQMEKIQHYEKHNLELLETETKLLQQMKESLKNYMKHNQEMISNLLSKNPGNINKARSPDGTENAELTITMKHADVDQSPADDGNHTDEIMEAPKPKEAAPTAMGEDNKQKPWRFYSIPQGHVFVLDCAGDEITVHVRPPSAGLDEELTRGGATCSSRLQQQPILYDYGSHRTLFLSRPGEERVVPVPWPRAEMFKKLTAAMVWGQESPAVKEKALPGPFKLSPDVVMFYQPAVDGMSTNLHVSATEVVEYKKLSEEVAARAGKPLTPPTILSTSFPV